MPGHVEFGRRLRLARRRAGKTQEDVATELGVTARTLARWEAGESSGFLPEIDRIAAAVRSTPAALLAEPEPVDRLELALERLAVLAVELRELRALIERRLPEVTEDG